jgi:hypothetical protein
VRSVEKKLQSPRLEWVARVSILRPGFLFAKWVAAEKPRSQNRDLGHPLNIRPQHFQLLG